jgi:beta-glucosidase
VNAAGDVVVSVEIKNTGSRAGDEVVQMYVRCLNSAVERPIRQLRGFERITLQPNETRTVRLPLKGTDLAYWDMGKQSFVVEPGRISIMVGASSVDARLEKTIDVTEK